MFSCMYVCVFLVLFSYMFGLCTTFFLERCCRSWIDIPAFFVKVFNRTDEFICTSFRFKYGVHRFLFVHILLTMDVDTCPPYVDPSSLFPPLTIDQSVAELWSRVVLFEFVKVILLAGCGLVI